MTDHNITKYNKLLTWLFTDIDTEKRKFIYSHGYNTRYLDHLSINVIINKFAGYGNLKAKTWFIGQEESSDKINLEEFINLFNINYYKYNKNIIDIGDIHHNSPYICQEERDSGKKGSLQQTLKKLLRIYSIIHNECDFINSETKIQNDIILDMQCTSWGRVNGEICALELFPFPNKKGNDLDDELKNILKIYPDIIDKLSYEKKFFHTRVIFLKKIINIHKPKLIIDYSGFNIFDIDNIIVSTYKKHSHSKFNDIIFRHKKECNVDYICINHINNYKKNSYLDFLGNEIKNYLTK